MAKIRTHYDNLKVARDAPDSVIKAAYKALCQSYHPDKFQGSSEEAERIMKIFNASYVVLIDPVKRAIHDVWIREQEAKVKQESEKAQFGKTDEATEQQHYQRQDKHDNPKTKEPPTSTNSNQQSYSNKTEQEQRERRREQWRKASEEWRNKEQGHNQEQDTQREHTPSPPESKQSKDSRPSYSWLRWIVFVVCCFVALFIRAIWIDFDRINGGGVGGLLRGAIIFGPLLALWGWAKSGNKPKTSPEPYQQHPQELSSDSPAGKGWLLWIGAIIVVIWLYSKSGNENTVEAPTYNNKPHEFDLLDTEQPKAVNAPVVSNMTIPSYDEFLKGQKSVSSSQKKPSYDDFLSGNEGVDSNEGSLATDIPKALVRGVAQIPESGKEPSIFDDFRDTPAKKPSIFEAFKTPKQPEQPLPQSGDNNANFQDGVAPLKIRTSSSGGHHYFVKIVKLSNGQPIGAYFIRSGETIDIKIPLGTYEIRYASGTTWYGLDYLFGPDTTYNKADSTFDFSFDGHQYSGYTIELIMQQNGNLRTTGIQPSQW